MKKFFFFAAIALTASADKPLITSTVTPISGIVNNPCTSEAVQLTGEVRVSMHLSFDSAGNPTKAEFLENLIRVHGVGLTSGTQYIDAGFFHYNASGVSLDLSNGGFCDPGTGQCTATFESHENLVSAGGGENFTQPYLTHITFDAQGNLRVQIYNYPQAICR